MPARPHRRELLLSFLGPAALAGLGGCDRRDVPLPPGTLVGTSVDLGHRLRDRRCPIIPTSQAWESCDTLIVGGGVAGFAAAWRLARAGVTDFQLWELESELGGTSRSGQSPTGGYPWGAHYIPAPMPENRLLVTLLTEMGIVEGHTTDGVPVIGEQFLCRDPQERVFFRGRWYEGLYLHIGASPEDIAQLTRFQHAVSSWANWRDGRGRRAFTIPMAVGSDDPTVTALDRLSMSDWLAQRQFTSPRLLWLVDYACRDDYGLRTEQTSAWAGLFYFASRLPNGSAEAEPLITWPEGNARLVHHLAKKVGSERVHTGWAVTDIHPVRTHGQEHLAVTALSQDGQRVRGVRARRVLFAAPQFLARYLIRPFREQPPAYLSSFAYGSWMVANLHLQDRPRGRGFPLAWDNVLYESPSLGYVVNTHQLGADHGPAVFTYYYPLTDADPRSARSRLLGTDRDSWADVILTDLAMAHPNIRAHTHQLDVMRWGHAMIRPTPGFIWGGDRPRAQQPFMGIHFAGADLSGLPLFEEALYHGVRAAEEVLQESGKLLNSWL
ncbi:MAG: FAD-dependent oxidoreductase [Bacteroidales bacterium]|nr:FAD-dependent oxidoreductase [Bacteroidales bacterium]